MKKIITLLFIFSVGIIFSQSKIPKNGFYSQLYSDGKTTEMTGWYKNGLKDGAWIKFFKNGTKESIFNFREGKRNGKYFIYDGGRLSQEGFFENDSLSGITYVYDDRGLQSEEIILDKKNKLKKIYKYDPTSGMLLHQGYIRNEKKDSTWVRFYLAGNKRDIENYRDNIKDGSQTHFYPNGKIASKENFISGKQNGKSFSLNEQGDTIENYNYVNGVRDGKFLDFRAGLLREAYGAKMIPLYLKGNLKNGTLHGEFIYYFTNGKIAKKENFADGILEGPKVVFDSLGNRIDSSNYKNNQRDGKAFHFFTNGKIEKEEIYEKGNLSGMQKTFYENGKPKTTEKYVNGSLIEKFNFDEKGKKTKQSVVSSEKIPEIIDPSPINFTERDSVSDDIFLVVDEMAEYPGGMTEMNKFIQKNIRYPEAARDMGITGKVFIQFIVEIDGRVTGAKVLKGIKGGVQCDNEALRVIKLLPNFKPGKMNGKAVRVTMNVPIKFSLQ